MDSPNPAAPAEWTDFPALARHLDVHLERHLGRHTWLARTPDGRAVVLQSGAAASAADLHFLMHLGTFQPPFAYPRQVSGEPGHYLVYDFIPGQPLSSGDFEADPVRQAAWELSGRLTALFRSLKLGSWLQGMGQQGSAGPPRSPAQRLAALGASLGARQDSLATRRWEAAQSYAWAQEIIPWCARHWPGEGAEQLPWEELQAKVAQVTSIHLATHGSGLAHTAFTPKHLLQLPDQTWGVVGWRVAPRPYNYMRYRFLAWSLVHTPAGEVMARYRGYLSQMPAIASAAAHPVTMALALLESWVEAAGEVSRREEKLAAIKMFLAEALAAETPTPGDPPDNLGGSG